MAEFGIDLTGGGARGSYQAGVLLAFAEILKEQGLTLSANPFKYISGVSAGSINAAFCAAQMGNFLGATQDLVELWKNIEPKQVYRTDLSSIGSNAAKWVRDLSFGSLTKDKLAKSLLDTSPLWDLVKKIQFQNIDNNISKGLLFALSCSAYSYNDNRTVTFLQTEQETNWDKPRRYSKKIRMAPEHVMASCAIPILFPSIEVNNEYFGDGGFRNTSPISPIIHMGARKVLMVGVRGPDEYTDRFQMREPGIAKIAGVILNALFFDTIDIDLERVKHINEFVMAAKKDINTDRSDYTAMDFKIIRPSRDISLMASEDAKYFPRLIKLLIGGLGSTEEYAELASYLLFVPEFTTKLIELGYEDFYKQKDEFVNWLEVK